MSRSPIEYHGAHVLTLSESRALIPLLQVWAGVVLLDGKMFASDFAG